MRTDAQYKLVTKKTRILFTLIAYYMKHENIKYKIGSLLPIHST